MNRVRPESPSPPPRRRRYSTIRLPAEAPAGVKSIFEYFLIRFPRIDKEIWRARFREGKVFSREGRLPLTTAYKAGLEVHYYREVDREPPVRRDYRIVFEDPEILIVDKPPHLPVTPGGKWVDNCLLAILEEELGEAELSPLHRIDRLSSGLLMFSRRKGSRSRYSRIFQPRPLLRKEYLVVCELRRSSFPERLELEDHIRASPTAFYRQEVLPGVPANARLTIRLEQKRGNLALYRVRTRTGRKHQIRVQLAHAGLPILGDPLYGTQPRYNPQDLSIRLFLDAHFLEIGAFPPLQGRVWTSREETSSFLEEASDAFGRRPLNFP